jgi:predicted phosphoribosyltransferase
LSSEKTVIVVDDFCTEGHSLDAARVYIRKAGAKVVCLSWLKTINTNYKRIRKLHPLYFNPYQPNQFSSVEYQEYIYRNYISDRAGPEEIDSRFAAYDDWFNHYWTGGNW